MTFGLRAAVPRRWPRLRRSAGARYSGRSLVPTVPSSDGTLVGVIGRLMAPEFHTFFGNYCVMAVTTPPWIIVYR